MAMENPIKSMMPKDTQGPGMGGELREKLRMQKEASDSMKTPAPVVAPTKPVTPSPVDKVNPSGQYGDRPGEKRPSEVLKGIMHKGGTVPETGPYLMKKGEKVLTPEQHSHLQNAMGLAHSVLAHDPDAEPAEPKKEVREMRIRKAADGTHVIEHHHVHFSHPMEEHTAKNMDDLHDHMEQHWGGPNDGEEASENEMDGSPAVVSMQKALGYTK